MVIASYTQVGDQYGVTVAVMDSKTGQMVDKNTVTGEVGEMSGTSPKRR